jgi:tetratricopeptide (TPR) repeat protein
LCSRLPLEAGRGTAVFVSVFALIVGLHSVRTVIRNGDWKSQERLYLHDVHVVPNSSKALNNAGKALQDLGKHQAAIGRFDEAIAIEPTFRTPSLNRAYSLSALGREDEAISMLEHEIQRGPQNPAVYNNLGFLLVDRAIDVRRGVRLLEEAVELRPHSADFLDSLAWGYYKLGRLEEARELLQRSLQLDDWGASTASRRAHLETIERALSR